MRCRDAARRWKQHRNFSQLHNFEIRQVAGRSRSIPSPGVEADISLLGRACCWFGWTTSQRPLGRWWSSHTFGMPWLAGAKCDSVFETRAQPSTSLQRLHARRLAQLTTCPLLRIRGTSMSRLGRLCSYLQVLRGKLIFKTSTRTAVTFDTCMFCSIGEFVSGSETAAMLCDQGAALQRRTKPTTVHDCS